MSCTAFMFPGLLAQHPHTVNLFLIFILISNTLQSKVCEEAYFVRTNFVKAIL